VNGDQASALPHKANPRNHPNHLPDGRKCGRRRQQQHPNRNKLHMQKLLSGMNLDDSRVVREKEEKEYKNANVTVLKGSLAFEKKEQVEIHDRQKMRLIIGREGETVKYLQRKHEVLVRQQGHSMFVIIGEKANREALKADFQILIDYPLRRQIEKYKPVRMCENDHLCFSRHCKKPHPIGRAIDLPKEKRKCRFGEKCRTINCPFYHENIRQKPACLSGAACTKPNCSFLHPPDRCSVKQQLPKCKFGLNCSRKDCRFGHDGNEDEKADDNKSNVTPFLVPKQCRYAAECRNPKCFYEHPSSWDPAKIYQKRDCRFGLRCRNYECLYNHPEGYEKPAPVE